MHPITLLLAALAPLTAASPSPILSDRQGGSFVAVGNKYSAGGCTDQSLIFADPIFGNGNVCQPLNRNEPATPVVSYKTLSTTAGCSGEFGFVLCYLSFPFLVSFLLALSLFDVCVCVSLEFGFENGCG